MIRTLLKIFVALLIVTLVAGAVGWWWAQRELARMDELLAIPEVQRFEVERGEAGVHVLDRLADAGLVPSAELARAWLELEAKGWQLSWGRYLIEPGATPAGVLEMLMAGRVEQMRFTIPEGLRRDETVALLVAAGLGSSEELFALTADPRPIADLAPEAGDLEGFLFPDTYHLPIGSSAEAALEVMLRRFREVAASVAVPEGSSLYRIVTLASLVEAETGMDGERGLVASVYANRLRRGMLLQCDPTTIYAMVRAGQWRQGQRLLKKHLQIDDPYNTYAYPGLPPGPIASPGRAALEAAADPPASDYLFFVAAPEGGHAFSKNVRGHQRAVARWRRYRRAQGF